MTPIFGTRVCRGSRTRSIGSSELLFNGLTWFLSIPSNAEMNCVTTVYTHKKCSNRLLSSACTFEKPGGGERALQTS